jgi:hypothetical protein
VNAAFAGERQNILISLVRVFYMRVYDNESSGSMRGNLAAKAMNESRPIAAYRETFTALPLSKTLKQCRYGFIGTKIHN